MAKPMNGGSNKVDTYAKRQQQLSSQVFDAPDYSGYAPISKKPVDIDNYDAKNTTIPKGRKVDDAFRANVRGFEPVKKNYDGYNAADQKQSFLSSQMGPSYQRPATAQPKSASKVQNYTISGRETKATKQAFLASVDPATGRNTMETYNNVRGPDETRVVDLTL